MKSLKVPNSNSSLKSWLKYIKQISKKPINLDLSRVYYIANILSLFHPASCVIIVGGTNGKGSTCKLIEMILLSENIKVGVYSSPHLLSYKERIRVQGVELPDSYHINSMSIIESVRNSIPLSYFEFSTLSALQIFKTLDIDVAILEVGLGGRLDATNIVDSDVSVITSIGVDHVNLLGYDRISIAKEKSGIFRSKKPAVIGEVDRPWIIDFISEKNESILYACNRDWWWKEIKNKLIWWNNSSEFFLEKNINFLDENIATAVATISKLPFSVSEYSIHKGISNANLPGRFQIFDEKPMIILDVAHNPHAARSLSRKLNSINYSGKTRAVVGMLSDKDIFSTFYYLKNKIDFWYCVSIPKEERGADAEYLAYYLSNSNVQKFKNIQNAWSKVLYDSYPEDCVLVFGSFYIVSSVMSLFKYK